MKKIGYIFVVTLCIFIIYYEYKNKGGISNYQATRAATLFLFGIFVDSLNQTPKKNEN